MAKQLKATILARKAAKGPRKKRTRPKPRQYTIADWERARDWVAAAERRIDNERTNNLRWGRRGARARAARTVRHYVAATLVRSPRVMARSTCRFRILRPVHLTLGQKRIRGKMHSVP